MNCPRGHNFVDGRCNICGLSEDAARKARQEAESVIGSAYRKRTALDDGPPNSIIRPARDLTKEREDALYDLSQELGGAYARGEMNDAEIVREAIKRLAIDLRGEDEMDTTANIQLAQELDKANEAAVSMDAEIGELRSEVERLKRVVASERQISDGCRADASRNGELAIQRGNELIRLRHGVAEIADSICAELWGEPDGKRHGEAADVERVILQWLEGA